MCYAWSDEAYAPRAQSGACKTPVTDATCCVDNQRFARLPRHPHLWKGRRSATAERCSVFALAQTLHRAGRANGTRFIRPCITHVIDATTGQGISTDTAQLTLRPSIHSLDVVTRWCLSAATAPGFLNINIKTLRRISGAGFTTFRAP